MERLIPWESIPDYGSTTTTTYELDSMQQVLSGRQTENTVSPSAIINPDDEFFLTPPKTSRGVPTTPYSGVVFILAEIDSDHDGIVDQYERGTGFLVSPNVVVTCAHCVVATNKLNIVNVKIYPYTHQYERPDTTNNTYISPLSCTYSSDFVYYANRNERQQDYLDWAIITLQSSVEGANNFACSYNTSVLTSNLLIRVSGYPRLEEDDEDTKNYCYLTTTIGQVTEISTYMLSFDANMEGGNSGSPVYYNNTCYAICRGVYQLPGTPLYNEGVKITQELYNIICNRIVLS